MYSTIHSMISLGVNGEIELNFEFFVNSFKRTHWVCCDPISGVLFKRSLNEWLRFLMGILWSELWKNPRVSFTKYPLGTVLSSFQKYSLSGMLQKFHSFRPISFLPSSFMDCCLIQFAFIVLTFTLPYLSLSYLYDFQTRKTRHQDSLY